MTSSSLHVGAAGSERPLPALRALPRRWFERLMRRFGLALIGWARRLERSGQLHTTDARSHRERQADLQRVREQRTVHLPHQMW